MAEQSINIKIKVDKQGIVELKSLEKGFDKIKITAKIIIEFLRLPVS